MKLSLVVITKNEEKRIKRCIDSAREIADEVIVIDNFSKDKTVEKAKELGADVYLSAGNLGELKALGVKKARYSWILQLDADESLSTALKKEIKNTFNNSNCDGFYLPFLNHFLQKPIHYGGENYKMLRLFKKDSVKIKALPIHEYFQLKEGRKACELKNKVYHYSYRSLPQTFLKFTNYSLLSAQQKFTNGEKINLKKLFLYAPHMFYARFILDNGYKDGLYRILLDILFAYMEGLTYWLLLFFQTAQSLKKIFLKSVRRKE